MGYNKSAMKRIAVLTGFLMLWALTYAQLNWVGNTRLFISGYGQLPTRLGMMEPWQTLTITTQTNPIAPGQRVVAVVTTDNWQSTREYDFSFDFNTGGNTQWYVVLGPYPAGTHVQCYIRAEGSGGQVRYDNNGGSNFSVFVRYAPQFRDTPILQWFQTDYRTIMRRLPEVVTAGYGAIYLPSPVKSGGGGFSTGYNPFDLFDLGDRFQKGTVRTQYGTTQELMELIQLAQRLGLEVYCDLVVNHADNRASTAIDRYPGLIPEDFHIRSTADPNNNEIDFNNAPPFGFGTLNYDIVGLADYAHEDGNNTRTGAFNLPSYASFNQFGKPTFVRHPFNPHYYPDGAPASEDIRQYLKRWGWFLTSVIGFDGYRIDAVRHAPPAFFARTPQQPGGTVNNGDFLPYLYSLKPSLYVFGEIYSSNSWELREYAKTGINPLDFPMKFNLRNLFNQGGFGDLSASLANGFGLDPSTGMPYELGGLGAYLGVGFVQSHDDGPPQSNNLAHAWLLTRPGRPLVYYDGNNIDPNNWSHFPRPGRYNALGNGDDSLLRLLDVRKRFARGALVNRWTGSDLYIYERQVNGHSLLLVGLNDRGDLTPLTATVQTNFPPGTVLVDYSGQQPPVTVDANRRVTITVPPNSTPTNSNNAFGYVLYAPRTPAPLPNTHPIELLDPQDNALPFQTEPTPGGLYASGRSFEAVRVSSSRITVRVRTDTTGVAALLKINQGAPINGVAPLHNTPEGLAEGYVPMNTVAPGQFEIRDIDLSALPAGLNVIRVRVFADTGGRPGLFSEFTAFFYLQRSGGAIVVDGNLNDLGAPLAVQTRTPTASNNRLDALYVRNDHRNLYIGIAGHVDTAENRTNGVALFIDTDFGMGTGLRNLTPLDDDSGPATRLLSNHRITAPDGFGAEFGVGVFRHGRLHSAPEADFVGDRRTALLVGAEAGFYRLNPSRPNWLEAQPAQITWRPRPSPSDPPTGLEIALPLDVLYANNPKAGRPLALFAVLLNTGEIDSIWSAYDSRRSTLGNRPPANSSLTNQFLPPQPNIVNNPGAVAVTLQAVATYTLQPMPLVSTPYRIILNPTRRLPGTNIYRTTGRVVNASSNTIPGPVALVVKLPPNVELVNRTGMSLFDANSAYLILSESALAPAGVLEFELRLQASSQAGLPPKMELRAGVGAL
ncbi:MAG: alpha-amylase family glycosyl hydrolase [Fimbriimonadales bacterium]